jgi:hypothetical protein
MAVCIRKLVWEDLKTIEKMAVEKLSATNTNENVFADTTGMVFSKFVLPTSIYGSHTMKSFGYFEGDELVGVLGLRVLENQPAWILSFIVTGVQCKNSIEAIKELMNYAIEHQESEGYFQWYVVSKLDKFRAWQKLFKGARSKYHHYVYARTQAMEMPKWLATLQLSSHKLFPYDTNISLYMSKKLCTSLDDSPTGVVNELDITFL